MRSHLDNYYYVNDKLIIMNVKTRDNVAQSLRKNIFSISENRATCKPNNM